MADEELQAASGAKDFFAGAVAIVQKGRQAAYATVNKAMIETYWKLGRHIVDFEQGGEKRADYGTETIGKLAVLLTEHFGRNFSARNLRYYRRFYQIFPDRQIWNACVPNLTWTHFRYLLRVDDAKAREWYLQEAAQEQWSARTLDRNISSQYYERLLLSQRKEPVKQEMQKKTADLQQDKLEFIKNPVVAEFLGLAPNQGFTENELEGSIIMHLSTFLMELGKGYAFVARQQHIRTDAGNDYFIDLVFYNYILKCFVLIDLKTTKISYQDVGQMDMYLQIYDGEGWQQGGPEYSDGESKGWDSAMVSNIKNLMETSGWDARQTMNALKIPAPSPTDFVHNSAADRYDDVEIIPPGFHDETEPSTDTYPVIADDDDFLYIEEDYWHKKSADIHARYRLVLKDAEMSCKALGDLASTCPVNGALTSSNRFDEVHKKAKELLPKMKEARERLDAMYETAVTIRTTSSNMTNQFMQVYWNAYNSPNMTGKDDHEAACCKAIAFCMDNGATQSEVLKLVDTKAPMAVWEKDGQYAIRTLGDVNREREAAKESSTDRSR